ncbi:MAG: DUF1800 domain-containing protein [Gemmatimonadota bacterium]
MQLLTTLLALLVSLIPGPITITTPPPLTALDSARHALNRLAYGATPGLADEVARQGVMKWIDHQLDAKPGRDPALEAPEKAFAVLETSPEKLAHDYAEALREARMAKRAASDSTPMTETGKAARAGLRGIRQVAGQIQELVVVRGAVADQQLFEIMADFWTNHFNVFYGKNLDRAYLPGYIETTIRPHVLGRFDDLLIATAESPAMLVYLDNALSVAPGSEPPRPNRNLSPRNRGRSRPGRMPAGGFRAPDPARMDSLTKLARTRRPSGINENYARELMELHTLGVDGGYTQQDVVNVARILTGWSVARPLDGGEFEFHDWAHDRGEKVVLGTRFRAGKGRDEGVKLLKLLANHPSTMHFVSTKLCARFVNDAAPDGCTDDAVRAWKQTGGNIKEVLRAIFHGPDFWAPANVAAKIKTPLEFVVSAVRALGGAPDSTLALAQQVGRLGQPLYLQSAPTGYPESQAEWVNSGALLNRMNFALALAGGRLRGVTADLDRITPATADPEQLIEAVDRAVLGGRMSPNTRAVIHREIADIHDPVRARALAFGLALGGPEFQRQ